MLVKGRIFGVDGIFLSVRFVLALLIAIGIDANDETTILTWSLVESENLKLWKYFFACLQSAVPEIFRELLITISDRDKGLEARNAKLELPDTAVHVTC